jgi:hypothetical protein
MSHYEAKHEVRLSQKQSDFLRNLDLHPEVFDITHKKQAAAARIVRRWYPELPWPKSLLKVNGGGEMTDKGITGSFTLWGYTNSKLPAKTGS